MFKKIMGLAVASLAVGTFVTVTTPKQSLAAPQTTQKVKNTAQLDTLKVNVPAQVTVKTGDEFTVTSNFDGKQKPNVIKNGDHIDVTFKNQQLWDQLKHNHKLKTEVVVTIPKITNPNTVKINASDVTFNTPAKVKNLQVNSNGGNVTLNKTKLTQTTINTANGDVTSNDSQLGKTDIKSASGDVRLRNSNPTELAIESGSGDVTLHKVDTVKPVKINSSSGDVALSQANLNQVKVNSGSGEIETHDLAAKNLIFNSGSGDVTIDSKKQANYHRVKIDSNSGDVQIKNAKINYSEINTDGGDLDLKNVAIKHKDTETK
ncbi:DUF4097 family beta strand repeat-containing protein [Fructilactobacillus carniphilus]|uniref:DUF4097 domain-containing protein n=1 Tax=Fructilactobacillus carniphilus TaxID=2940297 RepID=A0ABY5BZC2_9LACO|nr:DUF4097 family beta strand repeat-containing protein [Fructilactobacillus carniphilus]USS90723.1 DUF4097 domain-containing protein [Fructilactobacillus carniphilus]